MIGQIILGIFLYNVLILGIRVVLKLIIEFLKQFVTEYDVIVIEGKANAIREWLEK